MVKHNNVIANSQRFKKHWLNDVCTWFNQHARKTSRHIARQKKKATRCPTLKYNMKTRAGRGSTPEELKAAGIQKKCAPTIGIAVDHRLKHPPLEGLRANVQRLRASKGMLAFLPSHAGKLKAGGICTQEELATATEIQGDYMPVIRQKPTIELVKVINQMKAFGLHKTPRREDEQASSWFQD